MKPPFKHILLTTDLSDDSLRAFDSVARLARAAEGRVTLLCVVQDVILPPATSDPLATPLHAPDVEPKRAAAAARLEQLAAEHLKGLPVDCHALVGGAPEEAIGAAARDWGCDLIAMSTHGRSGFQRLVLGSVAEGVLRHSDVPVLFFPRASH